MGGFDDRYAPAYYEDTDLCLRLAERGMSVVYEPRSTVTHVRYGSGGLDQAVSLSERNRKLFAERFARATRRPARKLRAGGDQAVIRARDAVASPRLLICADPAEPSVQYAIGELLEGFPRARLTWITPAGSADGSHGDDWLTRGVELLGDPDHPWLDQRLFHYDAVLRGPEATCELLDAVARTQPQAPQIALDQLAGAPEQLVPALAAAGVAPPGRVAG